MSCTDNVIAPLKGLSIWKEDNHAVSKEIAILFILKALSFVETPLQNLSILTSFLEDS